MANLLKNYHKNFSMKLNKWIINLPGVESDAYLQRRVMEIDMVVNSPKEVVLEELKNKISELSQNHEKKSYRIECMRPKWIMEETFNKTKIFCARSDEEALLKIYSYMIKNVKWQPDHIVNGSGPTVDLFQYALRCPQFCLPEISILQASELYLAFYGLGPHVKIRDCAFTIIELE
jgi:hypothetical protein